MPVLTTSGLVLIKIGKKADIAWNNISGSNQLVQIISGAEAVYCVEAGYNLVQNYASLNSIMKSILDEGVSSRAAMVCLSFDMEGQSSSRVESESKANLHRQIDEDDRKLIREKRNTDLLLRGSSQ